MSDDTNTEMDANTPAATNTAAQNPDMSMLMDVNMAVSIEIGRANVKLKDVLNLSKGSVIELDKMSGEPLDIYANGKLIAHGDVVSVNGKYGIRLTSMPKNPTQSDG